MAATPARVPWREVVTFCVLAYAFTWAWDAIWVAPRLGALLAAPTTPTDGIAVFGNVLYHLPAMFGPGLAALVMRLVTRAGVRGSAGLRRSWRLYLIALLAPIAFLSTAAALLTLAGQASLVPPAEPLTLLLVPLLACCSGWRSCWPSGRSMAGAATCCRD